MKNLNIRYLNFLIKKNSNYQKIYTKENLIENMNMKFKRRLFAFLEINGRADMISFFSEELKNRKLEEILMTDMGYSEKEVKVFIKGVMTVENQRYKVKTPGMKDRFKNVKQRKPVQGGSPGLGRGKS